MKRWRVIYNKVLEESILTGEQKVIEESNYSRSESPITLASFFDSFTSFKETLSRFSTISFCLASNFSFLILLLLLLFSVLIIFTILSTISFINTQRNQYRKNKEEENTIGNFPRVNGKTRENVAGFVGVSYKTLEKAEDVVEAA